jgi:hypothetical protein
VFATQNTGEDLEDETKAAVASLQSAASSYPAFAPCFRCTRSFIDWVPYFASHRVSTQLAAHHQTSAERPEMISDRPPLNTRLRVPRFMC